MEVKPEIIELPDKGTDWKALIGLLFGVALVIIAVALWQVSFWVGLAVFCVGLGFGIYWTCKGVATIIIARKEAGE